MQTTTASWDDSENHRTIEVEVQWQLAGHGDGVSIHNVTPVRVVVRQDGCHRTIGVHTTAGREHLASKIDEQLLSGQLAQQQVSLA